MSTKIQVRRGTATQWTSANPTLAEGEIGFETDTGKFKIGNGTLAWSSLTYADNYMANGVLSGTLTINTGADTNQGLIIRRNSATQSANLIEITNSAGSAILASVNQYGGLTATGIQHLNFSTAGVVTNNSAGYLSTTATVPSTNGGTGVSNTGTITVSGNTSIGSSTHTVTLNTGANTTLTLPSSGTVVTKDSTDQLTNKTYASNSYSTTTTLTTANDMVFLSASAAWTLTLPTPTAGKILYLCRTDATANTITVSGHINGTSGVSNTSFFASTSPGNHRVILISNGTSWYPMVDGAVT